MISRRSFFGALAALAMAPTLARFCEAFEKPKLGLFTNHGDLVGEWQAIILKRNATTMNIGSNLFKLMSKLENENTVTMEFNWIQKDRK